MPATMTRKRRTAPITLVTLVNDGNGPILRLWRGKELKCRTMFRLEGTALYLLLAYWHRKCPIGILLDRLEEEPAEAVPVGTGDEQDVRDAVLWLRKELHLI